jgi:hypothetical protein
LPSQISTPLHAFPSEQVVPVARFVNTQPVAGLQLSAVQALLSLQTSGVPTWHAPAASHISAPLQALPSEQDRPATPT